MEIVKVQTDDILSVGRAAKVLGVPRLKLYRWIKAKKVVSIRLGGILFIPVSEIERLKTIINDKAAT